MKPVEATIDYTTALNAKLGTINKHGSRTYDYQGGRSYDKIWVVRHDYKTNHTQRYIHAFVDRATGGLIKAASWKAPQKNSDGSLSVRFDLSTPEGFQEAVDSSDDSGFYLLSR